MLNSELPINSQQAFINFKLLFEIHSVLFAVANCQAIIFQLDCISVLQSLFVLDVSIYSSIRNLEINFVTIFFFFPSSSSLGLFRGMQTRTYCHFLFLNNTFTFIAQLLLLLLLLLLLRSFQRLPTKLSNFHTCLNQFNSCMEIEKWEIIHSMGKRTATKHWYANNERIDERKMARGK